jgi:plastocyanin
MRRVFFLRTPGRFGPGVLFLSVLIFLGASGAQATEKSYTVKIENMKFEPASLTLHPGETVVFENRDFFPHTVSSVEAKGAKFESGTIPSGKTFTWKAREPGTIHYGCRFHPVMKGKLIVSQ